MACTLDFRCLDEGFGGKTYKRKRAEKEEEVLAQFAAIGKDVDSMEVDLEEAALNNPSSKRQAVASEADANKPVFGRATYDGVIAGRVSGRNWKTVRTHRSSALKVSVKGTSVEQRNKEREIKKAYKERINELKEEIRSNKAEKRRKKEEREKRKQENILRSGTKLQVISNPKTLKKMAKSAKDRKKLKVVPDDLVHKSSTSSNKKKKN